jgi:hypothetical protein
MRQGLVSQDIAAGNASFVEVFSHEALSGALHHDLRFGPYRYWHGGNCRPAPINVASFTGASPSRHTRSRDHKGLDFYSRLADELLAAGSSTFIGGRAGRNHARLTTGRMSPPGTKRTCQ